jgi:hypothetical protein
MLTSSRFNYLIEITQKMIVALGEMRECYSAFPRLIDEEHAMIQAHRYSARLEEVCTEKTELSEMISQSFEELQQLSHQLFNIWADVDCEGTGVFPGDLSNCIQMLDAIQVAIVERHSEFASNVLALQVSRLKDEFAAFKKVAGEIKPKIELNRSALSGVVRSYQESTRVLAELFEQAQATYSPQGTQNKLSTGTSTIYVRA